MARADAGYSAEREIRTASRRTELRLGSQHILIGYAHLLLKGVELRSL
jgi:hypothetical protein